MGHTVSIRDLRNRGGDVIAEVERGASVIVTRDGQSVAELRPLPRRVVNARTLIARRRHLPDVDTGRLRADFDATIDMSL